MVYSLDALFGLPRKRAVGISHRPPLHGNLFFCNQESVDEYVAEKDDTKQDFQVVMVHFVSIIGLLCMYNLYSGLQ